MRINGSLPDRYTESVDRGMHIVAQRDHHDAVRASLARETLHVWAARQPGARPLQGRGVAWATRLSSGLDVVVRHSQHGGLLAPLTRDFFLAPSRAPRELEVSLRLRNAGIPTPDVVAYVTYPAVGPFCRADVATALVAGGDLPTAWADSPSPAARDAIVDSVGALLRGLRTAGAHHPDLNVKNVFISAVGGAPLAWVLDVDRVTFGPPDDARTAQKNVTRLTASIEKWRSGRGLDFTGDYQRRLALAADLESDVRRVESK